MPDITLLAFHSHGDVQIGPAAIPGVGSDAADDTEAVSIETEEESGGNTAVRALLVLGVLVAVAAAVKKFRGGDDERPEVPLEESDEIAPTQD